MSVVVLDESKSRCGQMAEVLNKHKSAVTFCTNTNEFMTRMSAIMPTRVFMDVKSWRAGTSVYDYFDLPRRLAEVPIVYYNAPHDFTGMKPRSRHGQDQVLAEPTTVETVVEAIRSAL